ncbi:unnamed protein product [Cuscuta epithymum]|uniref:Bidirectional sugar transporter SWEET n=1 Tax=Cuscuta epithymum TaxID=186058 RepID=A0AAV0D1C1_9ASTE|nr:unnamed protein product [Cuscuta epithymum]CAH9121577.1 unnamed protein product [Cuscuta epithymum]
MVTAGQIRTVVGVIGNVISGCLFLVPIKTFLEIRKKKDVEGYQFYPYVATVLNCMLWVFYGLPVVKPDSLLVITINGAGLVIELLYVAIYCAYDRQNRSRKRIGIFLLGEVLFVGGLALFTLLCIRKLENRAFVVGIFADIFNIMMYSSPLLVVKKVYETKSVKYMPFWLSLTCFANGLCWTCYALIKRLDVFLLISNGLGAIAGAIQLIVYAYYAWIYKRPADDKPAEVQLPASRV